MLNEKCLNRGSSTAAASACLLSEMHIDSIYRIRFLKEWTFSYPGKALLIWIAANQSENENSPN